MSYEIKQVKNENSTVKDIFFKVSKENVNEQINKQIKEFQQNASHKGYRKGKAPKNIVFDTYQERILQNATADVIDNAFSQYIKQEKVSVAYQRPNNVNAIKNVVKNNDYEFQLRVELTPILDVKGYDNVELVPPQKANADSKIVKDIINNILKRKGTPTIIKDIVEEADWVKVDVHLVNNKTQEKEFIAEKFHNPCYIGLKTGEAITASDNSFTSTVKEIKHITPLELDEENISKIGANSVKEFIDYITQSTQVRLNNEVKNENIDRIVDNMIEKTGDFAIPPQFIKDEMQLEKNKRKVDILPDEVNKIVLRRIKAIILFANLKWKWDIKMEKEEFEDRALRVKEAHPDIDNDKIVEVMKENYSKIEMDITNEKLFSKLLEINKFKG